MTTKPDTTTPLTYPPGPYGADVGDVAIPLNLAHCDANGTKSLEQFYKHPKVKVIQITVHTVWCPSCKTQSRGLGGIYSKYKDKGFEVFYIMTENAQAGSGRISGKECTDYTNQYSFGFPALLDSGSQQMRKYFDRNAVPLNLIITTKDMKIRYKKSGALPERMNGIIESYLQ
jgi:thiol-disulfide isomerase/thioredoxin